MFAVLLHINSFLTITFKFLVVCSLLTEYTIPPILQTYPVTYNSGPGRKNTLYVNPKDHTSDHIMLLSHVDKLTKSTL